VLYTITFKSGAQQEFDLDPESVVKLVRGFNAVARGTGDGPKDGILESKDSAILLSTIAAFGPYISMARKYSEPGTAKGFSLPDSGTP